MIVLVDGYVRNLLGDEGSTYSEWVRDIIRNNGDFGSYNADFDLYVMSNEAFNYWKEYLITEQDIRQRITKLKNKLKGKLLDEFESHIIAYNYSNIQSKIQREQIEVIEKYEGEL